MWNFSKVGTCGVYQMFKPCCVWDWVLLLDGAGRVIVVCVLGLWGCSQGSFFFVISRSVRGLKSEGAAIFLLANKGGNWHLVWFGRSWRLRQALWSGVFREAQSLPCEVLPVRRGLVRKDVDGRAERRAVKRCGGMEGPFRNDPNFFDWPIVKAVERSMQSWEHGDPGGGVCVYGIFSFSITKSQTHSQTHPETDPSNTPRNRHLKHTPQAHPETDTWHISLTHIL